MNVGFSDADFSEVERQLRERHVPQASDELRSRILGAVVAELGAERNVRRGGSAWPYAAMAACLLLGLGLAHAAAITSLIPESAGQREKAFVSAATLRRLSPELSEDDARQLSLFVSLPRTAVALPLPQSDPSPARGDFDIRSFVRGESK
jgi:hypothetical protein